ncbi:hypothetical protein Clacol_007162 [Clathrus columnatus]|uniref:Zn-dependent exopeptidase n=1 Tax=Clathrus columnatus TaxID=1419009 RepID=A0AAV5AF76_9AGAM|nr:hypothetical protein Clacol_007162 [Clathrus columnatus]
MSVKTEYFDDKKHADVLVLPTTSTTKSRAQSGTFSRLRRVVFAFGLVYLVLSWIPFRGDAGFYAQLSKPRILNGKPAEKIFLKIPNPEAVSAALQKYAKHAHVAGSEQDFRTAKIALEGFYESFGLSSHSLENLIYDAGSKESQNAIYDFSSKDSPRAWIDTYYSLLDNPQIQSLEIVDEMGNALWTADLEEVCNPLDEDANNACSAVPPFHGFSADGDVSGELVYGNYGDPEDYAELEKRGVDVTGKIMLVRYGSNLRGLKVQNAEERGAAGVLIYSDIRDDRGVTEENGFLPYPEGPARNPFMIQRGSVQFIPIYPGDPTTPGAPSYKNSTRAKDTNLPVIPSLPLSWANTQYLFSEFNRTGTVRLRLVNKIKQEIKPIWNTMMLIPGILTDEVVIVGNHRDAWVLGAVDPSSGSACMDEVVRGFGELYKKGWKPLRTIILASWDGEEYGLLGSTEWGEDFEKWISKNVVTYLNLDSSVSGSRWGAGASPSLSNFIYQLAQDIPHPTRENATLWDSQSDFGPFIPPDTRMKEDQPSTDDLRYIGPLGSGSDFTVFLQRIGVASTSATFYEAPGDAHSIYDSIPFVERFVDPGYHRFNAMSKFLGLETLRLADAIVLPLNTSYYALELTAYTELVATAAKELNIAVDLSPLNEAISNLYDATKELEKGKEDAKKALFKSLKRWHRRRHLCRVIWDRLCRLVKPWFGCDNDDKQEIEVNVEEMASYVFESGHGVPHDVKKAIKRIRKINSKLLSFESGFISEEGLPGRTWYKHFGVAPGKRLGYGATTFPALTESITLDKNATSARMEIERLSKLINKLAKHI